MKNTFNIGLLLISIISIAGCTVDDLDRYSYAGISSHLKTTKENSNLAKGYKKPPSPDSNDPSAMLDFKIIVKAYVEVLEKDLDEINNKSDNAARKMNDVVDAAILGFDYFGVRHVGSVLTSTRDSNFEPYVGYPEFPEFSYMPPVKPQKPLNFSSQFDIDLYNSNMDLYNRRVADFNATIQAYVDDAKHYIQNCKNDHEKIRQIGLRFSRRFGSFNNISEEEISNN